MGWIDILKLGVFAVVCWGVGYICGKDKSCADRQSLNVKLTTRWPTIEDEFYNNRLHPDVKALERLYQQPSPMKKTLNT